MSFAEQNPYQVTLGAGGFAAAAGESERTTFIRRTYLHLAGAVFAFIAIELVIFSYNSVRCGSDVTVARA